MCNCPLCPCCGRKYHDCPNFMFVAIMVSVIHPEWGAEEIIQDVIKQYPKQHSPSLN